MLAHKNEEDNMLEAFRIFGAHHALCAQECCARKSRGRPWTFVFTDLCFSFARVLRCFAHLIARMSSDKNGDGFISPVELAQTLSALGETLTEAEVSEEM